jgi:hypothetical protein
MPSLNSTTSQQASENANNIVIVIIKKLCKQIFEFLCSDKTKKVPVTFFIEKDAHKN